MANPALSVGAMVFFRVVFSVFFFVFHAITRLPEVFCKLLLGCGETVTSARI